MLNEYLPATPEVTLEVLGGNKEPVGKDRRDFELTEFTEYSFNSNYLAATDSWSFSVSADRLPIHIRDIRDAIGSPVRVKFNGVVQSAGYIDSIETSVSRSNGIEFHIEGRDKLSPVVDACADPAMQLKEGVTLLDALYQIFSPFGWTDKGKYVEDALALRLLRNPTKGGKFRKTKLGSKKEIVKFKMHLFRPYPREGVFQFASRVAQRFGLWIRLSPDGEELVIAKPNFDAEYDHSIYRGRDLGSNVLEGTVKWAVHDQPTVIVAEGWSFAGEFGHSKLKSILRNGIVQTEDPELEKTFEKFKGAKVVEPYKFEDTFYVPKNKVLYLHDDESHTQEQLDNYIKKEMSLLQRKSLEAKYTVEGHGQIVNGSFRPWTVDGTVRVIDKVAQVEETLYVLDRTFIRSRSGGTKTNLNLIRLHTLDF